MRDMRNEGANGYRSLGQWLSLVPRNLGYRPMRLRKYSRAAAIRFVELYVEQGSVCAAANEFGVHRSSVYKWLQRHREFRVMMGIGKQALEVYRTFEQREFGSEAIQQQERLSRHLRRTLRIPQFGLRSRSMYRTELCNHVGPTWKETAERIGIHRQTVAGWCRRYPDFARAQLFASARREIERFGKLLEGWNQHQERVSRRG